MAIREVESPDDIRARTLAERRDDIEWCRTVLKHPEYWSEYTVARAKRWLQKIGVKP